LKDKAGLPQANATAARLIRDKALEELVREKMLGNARAVIGDCQHDALIG
jgi:hypothetical protein